MSSSLAYTRSGSGAPLVLLHGIGLNRQSWNPVVPALARQFDVIAVDLPGFGDSALASPAQAGPRALAEAVAGLLAGPGVTRRPHAAPGRELPRRLGRARAGRHPPGRLGHPARSGRAVGGRRPAVLPDQ